MLKMILLILITLSFVIVGLFNPEKSLFWYSGKRTRTLSTIIYGILLFLLFYTYGSSIRENRSVSTNSSSVDTSTIDTAPAAADVASVVSDPEEERVTVKLKAIAARDWPNDFSTQEYWLNKELQDYKSMKDIPDNSIKRQAQRDWPYDFSTQKYWYDQQIEAKERLNRR